MIKLFYTCLLYLIQPWIILRLFLKARKEPAYKQRIFERYGFFTKKSEKPAIWIHSVSVGETLAAAPIVRQLITRYPEYCIVITTMTPAGSQQVIRLYGDTVFHVYVPYDLPGAVRRFLKKINSILAIFMETELWPNTFKACKSYKIPVMIANARLSERSFKKYAKAGKAIKNMLEAVHILAAQHESDAQRFLSLGLASEKLHITGSVKYDIKPPEGIKVQGQELRNFWLKNKPKNTKIIIAVSTHQGEETLLLPVFRAIKQAVNAVLFVIVPRHPHRFDEVSTLCNNEQFCWVRRSKNQPVAQDTDIVIADTMGEMFLLLSTSDIVYMGGTLVPTGGHNFMEPAMLALPQVAGPNVFNFQAVADHFQATGALTIVSNTTELEKTIIYLLKQPQLCTQMGEAGFMAVKQQQGALAKHLQLIEDILSQKKSLSES